MMYVYYPIKFLKITNVTRVCNLLRNKSIHEEMAD